jgi:hypothetical protein
VEENVAFRMQPPGSGWTYYDPNPTVIGGASDDIGAMILEWGSMNFVERSEAAPSFIARLDNEFSRNPIIASDPLAKGLRDEVLSAIPGSR